MISGNEATARAQLKESVLRRVPGLIMNNTEKLEMEAVVDDSDEVSDVWNQLPF